MCTRLTLFALCLVSGVLGPTLPYDLPVKGPYFPFDTRIIEDRWQVERFVLPLKKHPRNPLIVKEYEWEDTGPYLQGSVLFDPASNLYRMWYLILRPLPPGVLQFAGAVLPAHHRLRWQPVE